MIITLTMNPSIDRTVRIDGWEMGGTNRVQSTHVEGRGKGINVSLALKQMGVDSLALGLIGGPEGQLVAEELTVREIEHRLTSLDKGVTRVNVKVYDTASGVTTELNESGPHVSEADLEHIWGDICSSIEQGTYFICAGSLPPGVPDSFYADVIDKATESGVKVVLDASGSAFRMAVNRGPYLIKPNRDEAEQWAGRPLNSERALVDIILKMADKGPEVVILSLGADGALFYKAGELYKAYAKSCDVKSTVGCGDAMLAGALTALVEERSLRDVALFATAVATRTAEIEGTDFPTLQEISDAERRVVVEKLEVN